MLIPSNKKKHYTYFISGSDNFMYEIYNIQKEDTLQQIANKYGTTESILLKINGLDDNYKPIPNTQIIVPIDQNKTYRYYTVKKGDSIYQIAKNNNIDYELLLKINGLDKDDYIYPNQTILLPKNGLTVYLTKQSDTINDIIENLNTTLDELIEENPNIYLAPEQIIVFKEK